MATATQKPDGHFDIALNTVEYSALQQYADNTNRPPRTILTLILETVLPNLSILPQLIDLVTPED